MIRSNRELIYDARNGEKQAIIEVTVTGLATDSQGATYKVSDYAVLEEDSRMQINQKDYRMTNEQINDADLLVRDLAVFAGLSKTERDWLKIKLMLFQLTRQSPIYGSVASDWELLP